jgi:hypothetical protein
MKGARYFYTPIAARLIIPDEQANAVCSDMCLKLSVRAK